MGAAESSFNGSERVTHAGPPAKRLSGPPPLAPWVAGALEMPAGLLLELPAPPALGLLVHGVPGVVRVAARDDAEVSADDTSAAARASELHLDASEWRALVCAVEADRVWPAHARALLERKAAEPSFRITQEIALDGAQPDPHEAWTVAAVLSRLGAELLSVEL